MAQIQHPADASTPTTQPLPLAMPVTLTHITTDLVLSKFSSRQRKSNGSQGDWVHWTSPTLLVSLTVQATEQKAYHTARLVVIFRREGHLDITLACIVGVSVACYLHAAIG